MVTTELIANDPSEVGVDRARLDELFTRAGQEVEQGLLPATQVAVGRQGRIAGLRTSGDATDDSLFVVFSSTKPFVASGIWLLLQEGDITEETSIAKVIPEFTTHGKDAVTLQHVMLHTAGFPLAPYPQAEWNDRDARVRRFTQWRLDWEPGTKYQYHATSAHWVLVEVIERLTGQTFTSFLRDAVFRPLGLHDFHLGIEKELNARVKDVEHRGDPLTEEEMRALGMPIVPEGEVTEEAILGFNDPEVRRAGCPGGGGIAGAAELALFYQGILQDLEGAGRVWKRETIADVLRVRTGDLTDPFTGITANRGLGVIVAGDDGKANWRGFGHTCSAGTFGHGGAGGQIGWGDPASGVSLGYVTNGFDRNVLRQGRRGVGISSRAGAVTAPAV